VPICRDQVRIVSCNDLRPQDACDWSMDLALGCRHRKQVRNRAAAILCKYAGHLAAYVLYCGRVRQDGKRKKRSQSDEDQMGENEEEEGGDDKGLEIPEDVEDMDMDKMDFDMFYGATV